MQVPAQWDSLDLCMMGFLLSFQTSSAACIQVAFWSVSLLVLSRWNRHSQQTIAFVVTHTAEFEVFQVRQYRTPQGLLVSISATYPGNFPFVLPN